MEHQRSAVRMRHEPKRRAVEVVEISRIGANMVRIELGGDALEGFNSPGFDDHIKFMFDIERDELAKRDLTPMRFDAARRRLTLELVLHEGGAATEWAARAAPGTQAIVGGPKGSVIIPADYPRHVFAGDLTALPAIVRRLGELPAGVRAEVLVVGAAGDRRDLTSAAALEVTWLGDEDALVAAVAALDLGDGDSFVWCAGEADLMARLRQVIVEDKGHPRGAARISGYWKRAERGFHGTLETGVVEIEEADRRRAAPSASQI